MQFEFNDPESGDYAELYGKKIREQKVFVLDVYKRQVSKILRKFAGRVFTILIRQD